MDPKTSTNEHANEKAIIGDEIDRVRGVIVTVEEGVALNASGHKDQLKRQYGLLGVCGLAMNIDNAWIAFGGSVTIAIANGGPPGVLYELIVACAYYAVIGACVAEVRPTRRVIYGVMLTVSIACFCDANSWRCLSLGFYYARC